MGITSGTITCRSYVVAAPPEPNFLKDVGGDLKRHVFTPVRVERSPRSMGWVNARNVLDTDLTPEKAVYEDFLVLGLRVDKVSVNARLLKAYYNVEHVKALQERRKKQLGRDERAALLEKVRLEMMAKQTPATSLYEMAWNLRTHHVYFSATSASLNQEFCDLFGDTFHLALTPLFPFIRADMKAEKEGLAEELRATQASHFSPRGRSRMAVEESGE